MFFFDPQFEMRTKRSLMISSLSAGTFLFASCIGGSSSGSGGDQDPFATQSTMRIVDVSNGFGRLLPHVVAVADPLTGLPTSQVVEIRTMDDLLDHPPSELNPIQPTVSWPEAAVDPANRPGNHYVAVRFSRSLLTASVLDTSASGLSSSGLSGAITLVAYDQETGLSTPVAGRAFINGQTPSLRGQGLETWVRRDGTNQVSAVNLGAAGEELRPGMGFPGTDSGTAATSGFPGAGNLVRPDTFVFVADRDQNLATFETFPADVILRVEIQGNTTLEGDTRVVGGVRSRDGKYLEQGGAVTSRVGSDLEPPKVLLDGLGGQPVLFPPDLSTDRPCDQIIRFRFDESCQPHAIGPLPGLVPPALSNEFNVEFLPPVAVGSPPPGQTISVPYTVVPISPFDFTTFEVVPVVPFPGSDPFGAQAEATVTFFHQAAVDLAGNQDASTTAETATHFSIGSACSGLVNVPVAPGAIYIGANGGFDASGLYVIDLDGFGQGTGNPTFDPVNPLFNVIYNEYGEAISGDIAKFRFNPNLQVPGLFPPLSADITSLAGGSAGVFTLSRDSTLRTQLIGGDVVGKILDMQLGHPLDIAFNNFDCRSGGRNLCASAALQRHPFSGAAQGNGISSAPHPNPPRLRLAPSCFSPLIQAEEPTAVSASRNTLMVGGDAFGVVGGQGPTGLLTNNIQYQGSNFSGPAPTQAGCPTFVMRQQVGHFLYVLDGEGEEIVVLNSNRMTVLDRIPISSPRDLAMSPDLNLLAITNNSPNTVSFLDTDPDSPTFHQIIKVTELVDEIDNRTGRGPTEVVWQPDGEDVLVLCERSGALALISGADLRTRKVIPGLDSPKLLAVTDRGTNFAFSTGLYYAYIVSESGRMSIFESGPDGIQGIGFDDFVGAPSLEGRTGFPNPTAIMIDPNSAQHGVYVAYSENGQAMVDLLWLDNAPTGPRTLRNLPGTVVDPNRRSKEWKLQRHFSGSFTSGAILDLALDDLTNFGDTTQALSPGYGGPVSHSGKGLHRNGAPVSNPQFLFAAGTNGTIDVIRLDTGTPAVQPIRAPGAQILCHYWRQ